jgi:ribosomal-protein-alanine acetyltransferase
MVRLRPATPADLAAILAIEHAVFTDPWAPTSFESEFGDPYGWFHVAVDEDGTVVGYAMARFVAGEGEVMNIAVVPARRGQGVGGTLLDASLAAATAAECDAMWLEVRVSNGSARRLYESRGFVLVGRRRGYYRRPVEDALVLRRPLDDAGDEGTRAGAT